MSAIRIAADNYIDWRDLDVFSDNWLARARFSPIPHLLFSEYVEGYISAIIDLEGNIALAAGGWYHVVVTYDTSAEVARVYVNGQLDEERSGFGTGTPWIGPMNIGAWDNRGSYERHFDGLIDDVRIYNYALSADEVRWLLCDRPPRGDLNRDCRVDFVDFAILASGWLDCGLMVQELCGQ